MLTMMARTRIDLQTTTEDVKAHVRRVIGDLEAIEQSKEPIFLDPRAVFLDLVLSVHQLQAAIVKCRRAWWP
jgi:hypothetical protein